MLELENALARILAVMPVPLPEKIPLIEAHGRIVAEQILSGVDLPAFDNSAMDGYAVRAADLASAKAETPVSLRLAGKVAAGEVFNGAVTEGICVRLFTGSPLPQGADAVVMQEDTRLEQNKAEVHSSPSPPGPLTRPGSLREGGAGGEGQIVLFLEAAKPWENVRLRGEDVKRGASIAEPGMVLSAGRISLLAATGITQVKVGRQPLVALLATGTELIEPGGPLMAGQIYESNRTGLAALARGAGAIPQIFPLVPDTLADTRSALEQAFDQCDIVATSGGVSVGEMDFVKQAFEDMGGKLQFWKVAIKPGRPFVFGSIYGPLPPAPSPAEGHSVRGVRGERASFGRQEKFLFGLPGNPVSALVTFLLLVRPALVHWQGGTEVALPSHPAVLAEALANRGERRHFMRVQVDAEGKVRSAGVQASHVLSSLAEANGLVDVPPETVIGAGTIVRVLRWE